MPQAHVGGRMSADLLDFAVRAPDRIAPIMVQGVGDPRACGPFEDRTLWVRGDAGASAMEFSRSVAELAGVNVHLLTGYTDLLWSDTAPDRTTEIVGAVVPLSCTDGGGQHTAAGRARRRGGDCGRNVSGGPTRPTHAAPGRAWTALFCSCRRG